MINVRRRIDGTQRLEGPMTRVLTGRTRHRAMRIPFTKRVVLVLQVEERRTGTDAGTNPNDAREYDITIWRDAQVEDLNIGVENES